MSKPLQLFFDECFGRPYLRCLAALLAKAPIPPKIVHYLEWYKEGVPDSDWAIHVAKQGYVLISTDRGKQCGGIKLPMVCRDCGLTHVLISGRIHDGGQFEKARAIITVWPLITTCVAASPPGDGYLLRLHPETRMPTLYSQLTRKPLSLPKSGLGHRQVP